MAMKRTCIQCGKEFELNGSEIRFYKEKKLSLPKRCKECREANKQNKENVKTEAAVNNGKIIDKTEEKPDTAPKSEKSAEKPLEAAAEAFNKVQTSAKGKGNKVVRTVLGVIAAAVCGLFVWLGGNNKDDEQPEPPKQQEECEYVFRTEQLLLEHYDKHGEEMGFASPEAYVEAANSVITAAEVLHKLEAEDGDNVYYLEETNEFVVVSQDGYLRTYFWPDDGKDYFERQ